MPFPEEIVTFPVMQNVTASDGQLIDRYQQAVKNQEMGIAALILSAIQNYDKKIITADYLNSITTTVKALEDYYIEKFSPAIVVSSEQPTPQIKNDMWFEISGIET